MGSSSSTLRDTASMVGSSAAYTACLGHLAAQGYSCTKTGGSEDGYFDRVNGGAEGDNESILRDTRSYEVSLAAKSVEHIVNKLKECLGQTLNIKPENNSIESVADAIKTSVNRLEGKEIKDEVAIKHVKKIAECINNSFTPGSSTPLINMSLTPDAILEQIVELTDSFTHGVNTDLLKVHRSLTNVISNISMALEVMKNIHASEQEAAKKSSDSEIEAEFAKFDEVYKLSVSEAERQLTMLKGLATITLPPALEQLNVALSSPSGEGDAFIKRIGLGNRGRASFSDKFLKAVATVGATAPAVASARRALKEVGLSITDYLNSPNISALDDKLERLKRESKLDIGKFIERANALKILFPRFKNSKSMEDELREDNVIGGSRYHTRGGADDEKLTANERLLKQSATSRVLIVQEFTKRLTKLYGKLLSAIDSVGPKLGKEIPLDASIELLVELFGRIKTMMDERAEMSLIGFYADATARSKKERFIGNLRNLADNCTSGGLSSIKDVIDEIIKTIEYYSDSVNKKYGGAITDYDSADSIRQMTDAIALNMNTSGLELGTAVERFVRFYYAATVRRNMKQSAEEIKVLGKNYETLLGDAVGHYLNGNVNDYASWCKFTGAPAELGTGSADLLKKVKTYMDEVNTVKRDFYKALQAIDLLLMAFTRGIESDPDAVMDLMRDINDTTAIQKWHSSCESLAKAFDLMRAQNYQDPDNSAMSNPGPAPAPPAPNLTATIGRNVAGVQWTRDKHYYEIISEQINANPAINFGLGHPVGSLGMIADEEQIVRVKREIDATWKNFQALKNIVNMFARIGSKFAGEDIMQKSFMNPTQIYMALHKFLVHSSFVSCLDGRTSGAAPPSLEGWTYQNHPVIGTPSVPYGGMFINTVSKDGKLNCVGFAAGQTTLTFNGVVPALVVAPNNVADGIYEKELRYFNIALRAMSAKVLVTIGVHDMLTATLPFESTPQLRMIVGGGDGYPDIIEEATELYFRIPRLMEFYYEKLFSTIIALNAPGVTTKYAIGMFPELTGVFSGLFNQYFLKTSNSSIITGTYSDSEYRGIISEINHIYKSYSSESDPTASAIRGLVREVNMRYGVVKKKDLEAYIKLRNLSRDTSNTLREGTMGVNNNVDILPDEGDSTNISAVIAPSDAWLTGSNTPDNVKLERELPPDRIKFDEGPDPQSLVGAIDGFRKDLYDEISKKTNYSDLIKFKYFIKQAFDDLKNKATQKEKYEYVIKLISSSSIISTDINTLIAFHETVILGLNVLNAICITLDKTRENMTLMKLSNIKGDIVKFLRGRITGGVVANHGQDTPDALVTAFIADANYSKYKGLQCTVADAFYYNITNSAGLTNLANTTNAGWGADSDTLITNENINKTADELIKLAAGAATQVNAALAFKIIVDHCIDYQTIMTKFLDSIFSLQHQGLIDVTFTGGCRVSFDGLRNLCEALMTQTKEYMGIFRNKLPENVITKYEGKSNADVGSIVYLEQNLIGKYFQGLSLSTLDTIRNDNTNDINSLSKLITSVFKELTDEIPQILLTNGAGAPFANNLAALIAGNAVPNKVKISYSEAIQSIIYYKTGMPTGVNRTDQLIWQGTLNANGANPCNIVNVDNAANGGAPVAPGEPPSIDSINVALLGSVLLEYRSNPKLMNLVRESRQQVFGTSQQMQIRSIGSYRALANAWGVGRLMLYNFGKYYTPASHSLLFNLYELIYQTLSICYDSTGGGKIYAGVVNPIANSGLTASVISDPNANAYPDLGARVFGIRGDPKESAVLPFSLALILQRLSRDVNDRSNISDHLISTLTDVMPFIKETMKGNLPLMGAHFNNIIEKATFISKILNEFNLNLTRPKYIGVADDKYGFTRMAGAAGALGGGNSNIEVGELISLGINDMGFRTGDTKSYFMRLLNNIQEVAYMMNGMCRDILTELNDSQSYFQTGENSISVYEQRFGKRPFMPLSLVTISIKPNSVVADPITTIEYANTRISFPTAIADGDSFRYLYGARAALLSYKTDLSNIARIGEAAGLESSKFITSSEKLLQGIRFLFYMRVLKADINAFITGPEVVSQVNNRCSDTVVLDGAYVNVRTYEQMFTANAESSVVALSTAPDQTAELTKMANHVEKDTIKPVSDRQEERNTNIITLQVFPINIHALVSSIPFINLLNYDFTFRETLSKMLGAVPQGDFREFFKDFMNKPTDGPRPLNSDMPDNTLDSLHRMFRGDTSFNMGRPKFLSDMFNSVLFRSIVLDASHDDPAGSKVSIGYARDNSNTILLHILISMAKLYASQIASSFAIGGVIYDISGNPNSPFANLVSKKPDGTLQSIAVEIAAANNANPDKLCMAFGNIQDDTIINHRRMKYIARQINFIISDLELQYIVNRYKNLPNSATLYTITQNNISDIFNIFNNSSKFARCAIVLACARFVTSNINRIMRIIKVGNDNGLNDNAKKVALENAGFTVANRWPALPLPIPAAVDMSPRINILLDGVDHNAHIVGMVEFNSIITFSKIFDNLHTFLGTNNKAFLDIVKAVSIGLSFDLRALALGGPPNVGDELFNRYGIDANMRDMAKQINEYTNDNITRIYGACDAGERANTKALILSSFNVEIPIFPAVTVNNRICTAAAAPAIPVNPTHYISVDATLSLVLYRDIANFPILSAQNLISGNPVGSFVNTLRFFKIAYDNVKSLDSKSYVAPAAIPGPAPNLTYIKTDGGVNEVVNVDLSPQWMQHLTDLGSARFDTVIVRELVFITNLQRILTLKLHDEIAKGRGMVVSSTDLGNRMFTEYDTARFLPNETMYSRRLDGTDKY